MIVELNNAFLKKGLICPPNKRKIEYVDSQRTGLYLMVQNSSQGRGTYYLRYNNAEGKTSHLKLGRTDVITLLEARKLVTKFKSEINLGADPAAQKSAVNAIPTLCQFFTDQYTPFASLRKRSFSKDESMFRLRINTAFGRKRLDQITRKNAMSFHNKLRESEGLSAASCDHHLKLLRRVMNLAVEWDIIEKNPLNRIPLFNEDNRVNVYIDDDQLRRLLKVLHTHRNRPTCNVLLFLLSTGARLNEALTATWSQVDRDNGVWVITALNSKSKRIRSVPLNDSAIQVLDSLDDSTEYLFVSHRTGTRLKSIHTGWKAIRELAGVPHLTIHQLRHSFASFLVNDGRTLYEVQQILGHSVPTVTQRYAHLSVKTLQSASQSASNRMNAAMVGNE